ncbi:hypothetical protein [Tardiphaga sp.]|uniref:hypothetical protein n=1 Tax=Tardiphaga sp. TaxID=1926292 RepID=UPI0026030F06|nr:hypothetical protein [Tardiphaga sp.]MDB5619497.1 hypothetical protein [Tardiphaga sp.]
MSRAGVIAISRKLFDQDDAFFGGEPFTRREAWQWLIAMAAWKPQRVRVSTGRGNTFIEIKRGQLSFSRAFMRSAWSWSSEKAVRTFLDRLETDGRIDRHSGQQEGQLQSIITICKYDEYQFGDADEGQASGQPKGQPMGQAKASQGPEEEEGKRKKKKSNAPKRAAEGFQKWYEVYPKKKAPKDAERAYGKVIASGEISGSDLLAKTETFAAAWRDRDLQFCPYPASWLNAGSYADEPEAPPQVGVPLAQTKIEAPTRDPKTFTDSEWEDRLQRYREAGVWPEKYYGAPPGHADCLAPGHVVDRLNIARKEAAA